MLLGTLMDDIKLKATHHSDDSYLLEQNGKWQYERLMQ